MSVRAYKVIVLETEEAATFNLWHNDEVVGLLHVYEKVGLDDDGGGIIEFTSNEVKEALQQAKQTESSDILTKMLRDTKKDGYAKYYCF